MQTFHIQNMTCGGCVRGVTRAIQSVDPAARVHADVPARRVQVVSDHDELPGAGGVIPVHGSSHPL